MTDMREDRGSDIDQILSAFFPPPGQGFASTAGSHPFAESVVVFLPPITGLERSFHGTLLV
jgi:hypothetical protein